MARLIVLTALDGVGKDTIAEAIAEQHACVLMKTPTPAFLPAREAVDSLALEHPATHYLFYLASVVHASDMAKEHLVRGDDVIMVRYLLDTVVYHRAMGLPVDLVYRAEAYDIRKPDLTILLTVDEATRQERLHSRGHFSTGDRVIEEGGVSARIRQEYQHFWDEFVVVPNAGTPEKVAAHIIKTHLCA